MPARAAATRAAPLSRSTPLPVHPHTPHAVCILSPQHDTAHTGGPRASAEGGGEGTAPAEPTPTAAAPAASTSASQMSIDADAWPSGGSAAGGDEQLRRRLRQLESGEKARPL